MLTEKYVVASVTVDRVVILTTIDRVGLRAAVQGIETAAAVNTVAAGCGGNDVVAVVTVQDVVTGLGRYRVVAGTTVDRVGSGTANQSVIAVVAIHGDVAAGKRKHRVVTDTAVDRRIGLHAGGDVNHVVPLASVRHHDVPDTGINLGDTQGADRDSFGSIAAVNMGDCEGFRTVNIIVLTTVGRATAQVQVERITGFVCQHRLRPEIPDDLAIEVDPDDGDSDTQADACGPELEAPLDAGECDVNIRQWPWQVDLDPDRTPGATAPHVVGQGHFETTLEIKWPQRDVDRELPVDAELSIGPDEAVDFQVNEVEKVQFEIIQRDFEDALFDTDRDRPFCLKQPDLQSRINMHLGGVPGNCGAAHFNGVRARIDRQSEVAGEREDTEVQGAHTKPQVHGKNVAADDRTALHGNFAEELQIQGRMELDLETARAEDQLDFTRDRKRIEDSHVAADHDAQRFGGNRAVNQSKHRTGVLVDIQPLDIRHTVRGVDLELEAAVEAENTGAEIVTTNSQPQLQAGDQAGLGDVEGTAGNHAPENADFELGIDLYLDAVVVDQQTKTSFKGEQAADRNVAFGQYQHVPSGRASRAVKVRRPARDDITGILRAVRTFGKA